MAEYDPPFDPKPWLAEANKPKVKPKVKPENDPVNHPSHYTSHPSGVECIEITRHHDFLTGNAIKYLWRAGLKEGSAKELEDLKKARWYIDYKINSLEGR